MGNSLILNNEMPKSGYFLAVCITNRIDYTSTTTKNSADSTYIAPVAWTYKWEDDKLYVLGEYGIQWHRVYLRRGYWDNVKTFITLGDSYDTVQS